MLSLYQPFESLFANHRNILVAFSGGRDSAALLYALAQNARDVNQGHTVNAVYVNHNIQEAARDWPDFARNFVAQLVLEGCPVTLHVCDVHLKMGSGDSLEALAREARYEELRKVATLTQSSVITLAHHRKDQVETFLLQALRGSGVAGLAAMPRSIVREGCTWERPWLDVPRNVIDQFVADNNISHIEDPTNHENHYARNKLRNVVLPVLISQFPEVETTITQSAQWCAEASDALQFVAENDLKERVHGGKLLSEGISAWPIWRQKNLLKFWYLAAYGSSLPANTLQRAVEIFRNDSDSEPKLIPIKKGMWLVIRNGFVSVENSQHTKTLVWDDRKVDIVDSNVVIVVPECNGYWSFTWGAYGLKLPITVDIGKRREGLLFQKGPNQPRRAIKNQFQSAGIAASERDGPYMYHGNDVMWAPGLGLDARFTDAEGWIPIWHNGPAPVITESTHIP